MKQTQKIGILKIMSGIDILATGGVGVMPTDTIYGVVGSALDKKAVKRIYHLRKRDLKKPMIVLIGDIRDLKLFGVRIDQEMRKVLNNVWPGKVSVVLPRPSGKFSYLHRGTKTLAFRLPKSLWLREFLKATGPLVAPSANIAGNTPSKTINEAKKYFADKVDFYADAGRLDAKPSRIIRIEEGKVIIVRS